MCKFIVVIFLALVASINAESTELPEVPCRLVFDFFYVNVGNVKCCLLDAFKPEFNQPYRIQSDRREDITALDVRNWRITNLPSGISEKFPNLEAYAATANHINSVSPCNFKGLKKLKAMYLSFNHIQEIPANTFAGLEALEHLHLQNNKISSFDPTALSGVNNLKVVKFMNNVCMDMSFDTPEEIETVVSKITEFCYKNRAADKSEEDEPQKKIEL